MNQTTFIKVPMIKRQQGWTFWTLLIALGLLIFFVYIGMQLVPVYSANNNVRNAMNIAFERAKSMRTLSRKEYMDSINRQLYLDGTHTVVDVKKSLSFTKDKNGVSAGMVYDRVVPLFYNISLKVDFDNQVSKKIN